MSLLLCHECYSWVLPDDGRCPDCQFTVDAATPDPSLDLLGQSIGELMHPIGEVRVRRKLLPERGMLYATTNGLFFLPHELRHETQFVESNDAGNSIVWHLAALAWSPLSLMLPFVKRNRVVAKSVRVFRPQLLSDDEGHRLPEFLMHNPGVFFIPRKVIRSVRRRRGNWIIERQYASTLRLRAESNSELLHTALVEFDNELAANRVYAQ